MDNETGESRQTPPHEPDDPTIKSDFAYKDAKEIKIAKAGEIWTRLKTLAPEAKTVGFKLVAFFTGEQIRILPNGQQQEVSMHYVDATDFLYKDMYLKRGFTEEEISSGPIIQLIKKGRSTTSDHQQRSDVFIHIGKGGKIKVIEQTPNNGASEIVLSQEDGTFLELTARASRIPEDVLANFNSHEEFAAFSEAYYRREQGYDYTDTYGEGIEHKDQDKWILYGAGSTTGGTIGLATYIDTLSFLRDEKTGSSTEVIKSGPLKRQPQNFDSISNMFNPFLKQAA